MWRRTDGPTSSRKKKGSFLQLRQVRSGELCHPDRCPEKSGVRFSTLFGGGAKYSNGEDSLFIKELMDKGIQVYTSPEVIGRETESESTWFSGYHDKFFFDRGVLYHFYTEIWRL